MSVKGWRWLLVAMLSILGLASLGLGSVSTSDQPSRYGYDSAGGSYDQAGMSAHAGGGMRALRSLRQPAPQGLDGGSHATLTTAPKFVVAAEEGIYVVRSEAGTYVGQSGNITTRLGQHVAKDKFTQAEVDAAERIPVSGGKTAREIAEQLKIDELGGIENLVNKVNPIGARRFDLMPDGYFR